MIEKNSVKDLEDVVMVANEQNEWPPFKWNHAEFVASQLAMKGLLHEDAKMQKVIETIKSARDVGQAMVLLHSEVSEALEAYRKHDKVLFDEEIADLMIRVLHTCHDLGIELEDEVLKKHIINLDRGSKHGGKEI